MNPVLELEPIPHPPGHPFVGNLFDIGVRDPVASLTELARKYGPIYQVHVPGPGSMVVVTGHDLVAELCDDVRFDKTLGPIAESFVQTPASRGLFAAKTTDPDWRMAHHILLPAFSADAMRGYFSQMLDVAVQLMQKWERLNPDDCRTSRHGHGSQRWSSIPRMPSSDRRCWH